MTEARPFDLIASSRLQALERQATAAAGEWCHAWGIAPDTITLRALRAADAAVSIDAWQRAYVNRDAQVLVDWSSGWVDFVQQKIFPPDPRTQGFAAAASESTMACAVARRAVDALTESIAALCGATELRSPFTSIQRHDWLFERGSGAVAICITADDHALVLVFDRAAVQSALPPIASRAMASPIAHSDVSRALAPLPVSVAVTVGRVELDASEVLTLAVGDVIRLPASVHQPIAVTAAEGTELFRAFLGRRGDTMALEIAPLNP